MGEKIAKTGIKRDNDLMYYIKSGDVTFTTDQQAYLQGFLPVQQLYLYKLSGGLVGPANSDTSQAYVTQSNVDTYLSNTRFEGRTDAEPS